MNEQYAKYREKTIARMARYRGRYREITRETKDVPCSDCGIRYPYYVMDLDHVRGKKLLGLSQMKNYSEKMIREEISKCEVVCSNCHRERTHMAPSSRGEDA